MAEADPVSAISAAPPAASKTDTRPLARRLRPALMLLGPVLIVGGGLWYWFSNTDVVSTDNAYVKADIVAVAGEVTGLVASANVRENQQISAGDVLFTINPSPYRVAIAQADAQIAAAQARVTGLEAEVGANAADLAGARDDLVLAQSTLARERALLDRGFNTRARMDVAEHAVASARDRLASVQAEVAKARAQLANGSQVPGLNPAIAAAQSQRASAELNLERTVVRAPASGRIAQSGRMQAGQMVFPGVPMVSIVRAGSIRIDANFKETDLNRMRPGQPADISIDAYPGMKLKGHVESIGAGTGSEFSVLPAQNATGNWVKVIQRVPVRIAIDGKPGRPLIAGLSAVVKVHVGKR
jgi:membrane fusion protein, multidrug efflux system